MKGEEEIWQRFEPHLDERTRRLAAASEAAVISQNWRGKPLISHEVIVNLIAATTTTTGLKVRAELDTGTYPTGRKVSAREAAEVNLRRDNFHGEWNYTILPRTQCQNGVVIS